MCIVWLSAYAAFLEFDNTIKIRWICRAPNNNTVLQIRVALNKQKLALKMIPTVLDIFI